MRRTTPFLIAAVLLVVGCSSSEDTTPTTTGPVVVSAENKAACAAIESYQNAASVGPGLKEGDDPLTNTTKIQAFIGTLIAPLEAVEAAAPAELKDSIGTLVAGGEATIGLDPASPENQAAINVAILSPTPEMTSARQELITWSATNCGISIS